MGNGRRYFFDKEELQTEFFSLAFKTARKSIAKKQKCGAVLVKNGKVISTGYNHMPYNWEPSCEFDRNPSRSGNYEIYAIEDNPLAKQNLESYPEVFHAESNAIAQAIHCGHSPVGTAIFITHAPCLNCAKLIYQMGIQEVWIWNWGYEGIEDTNLNKGGYDFLWEVIRRDEEFGTKSGLERVQKYCTSGVDTRTCKPFKRFM